MTAPVLGGILVADEVIDLLLPVMFYWVRRRRWEKLHGGEEETGDRGQVTAMAATSEQDSQASIAN
jgi:hypothetical protein